jgi:SAM-dependent methyltransferase
MKEQIWEARQDLQVYSDLSVFEFEQIADHIGSPKVVLEVGCGLGRGSIYLNSLLKDDSVAFILADRTGMTTNTGAYAPDADEFYNDLEQTAEFCAINGIKNLRTFDTEKDDWATLPQADLIFSLCSFGMHVAIERYIDRLMAASKPDGTMIFGTRGPYSASSFSDRFGDVTYLPGRDGQGRFPKENWLILKNPILQDVAA